MTKKCIGCGSVLQTLDEKKPGYVKDLQKDYCMRCFKLINYGKTSIEKIKYMNDEIINIVNNDNSYKIFLTDILNINQEVMDSFHKLLEPKILVISKCDIIPKSIKNSKIINFLKTNYQIKNEIIFISSKKNINTNFIINKLVELNMKKAYLLGYTNAGKSTYINKLTNGKITTSNLYNTTLDFINIPLDDTFYLVDTPGLNLKNNLFSPKDINLIKKANSFKSIKPITYQTKENSIINIENLIEISNMGINSLTIYLNQGLNIKRQFKSTLSLSNFSIDLSNNSDLVIKGIGFINIKKECTLDIKIKDSNLIEIRPSIFRK